MSENGIIVDKDKNIITVEVANIASNKCAGCSLKSTCCSSNQKSRRVSINAKNPDELKVGDRVTFNLPEGRGVLYSTLVFFVPIVVFLLPILAINNINDLLKILLGLLAMALYFALLKFISIKIMPSIHLRKG